jgi:hypothetical protein
LLFNIVLLLHLVLVIVGFGSNVVSSFLAARSRGLDLRDRHVLAHAAYQASQALTTGPVVAAGLVGVALVPLANRDFSFSQTWISLAFLLWLGMIAVLVFLVTPNARAMDDLGAKLTGAGEAGGTAKEIAELDERDRKAAAFTGIVHLLWVVTMIDMIWKPGVPGL